MTPFAAALADWLATEHGLTDITAETPLFTERRLDSLALVDLLAWVEAHAGVRVKWSDVSLDHFDTIARVEAYVQTRR